MPLLTIFTPTFNRANLLVRGYEALKRQSNKDFIWLIIDDGSTDDTRDVVKEWCSQEVDFQIRYIYKENGGLHTAYNTAIAHLDTELAVCVDSDDYMPDEAVARICDFWKCHGSECVAGIVGLDSNDAGAIIGDPLPDQQYINLIDLQVGKYNIKNGDRKLVVRSELYKSVAPQKVFPNEKNFNPHYMHLQISQRYDFLVMNEVLCIVEYQPGGMSSQIFNQYYNSPRSFAELRKLLLSFDDTSVRYRFKQCIHLVSSFILSGEKHWLQNSPQKTLTVLAIPFGFALSLLVRYKANR